MQIPEIKIAGNYLALDSYQGLSRSLCRLIETVCRSIEMSIMYVHGYTSGYTNCSRIASSGGRQTIPAPPSEALVASASRRHVRRGLVTLLTNQATSFRLAIFLTQTISHIMKFLALLLGATILSCNCLTPYFLRKHHLTKIEIFGFYIEGIIDT